MRNLEKAFDISPLKSHEEKKHNQTKIPWSEHVTDSFGGENLRLNAPQVAAHNASPRTNAMIFISIQSFLWCMI